MHITQDNKLIIDFQFFKSRVDYLVEHTKHHNLSKCIKLYVAILRMLYNPSSIKIEVEKTDV